MSVRMYSPTGAKQAGTVKVPEVKLSDTALSRVVRAILANDRRDRPFAKTRGFVRGGGTKPHRQKGTGRARAGSIRSPLWRGGGVTFGPSGEPRSRQHLPRALRRTAVQAVLATLAAEDRLAVIAGKPSIRKSKDAAKLVGKITPEGPVLFVVTSDEYEAALGARNLGRVELTTVDDCNAADLVRAGQVVVSRAAFDALTVTSPAPTATSASAGKKPTAKKPAVQRKS